MACWAWRWPPAPCWRARADEKRCGRVGSAAIIALFQPGRSVMTQDQLKQAVAQAAVDHILPLLDSKSVIGVGTGSTANFFIDALARHKMAFDGAVASSEATAARLKGHGIPVYDLNSVSELEFYIDGADESDEHLHLIKGGGAALTREKIVAAVARTFICIADGS